MLSGGGFFALPDRKAQIISPGHGRIAGGAFWDRRRDYGNVCLETCFAVQGLLSVLAITDRIHPARNAGQAGCRIFLYVSSKPIFALLAMLFHKGTGVLHQVPYEMHLHAGSKIHGGVFGVFVPDEFVRQQTGFPDIRGVAKFFIELVYVFYSVDGYSIHLNARNIPVGGACGTVSKVRYFGFHLACPVRLLQLLESNRYFHVRYKKSPLKRGPSSC